MSELPAGWREVPLGEVAQTDLGKMLDRGKVRGGKQVPYLRNQNVQWGRFDLRDVSDFELLDDELDRFEVCAGDLLVCEGGEIGRCAIWPGSESYIGYQKALHRVRPDPDLDARFLSYSLEDLAFRGALARRATGSTIKHLPQVALRELPLVLPPLDDQHRIVALLEDHLTRLEAAERYLAACARRSGRLQPPLPGDARRVRLGDLIVNLRYGTSVKCSYKGAGPPVLRIPNVARGAVNTQDLKYATEGDRELAPYEVGPDDVLVIRSNGSLGLVGRMAPIMQALPARTAFASYLLRMRLDQDRVLPAWVAAVTAMPDVRRQIERAAASSAGQHNLNKTALQNLQIPLPDVAEQRSWLGASAELTATSARLNAELERGRHRGAGLRTALLTAALTGQV